MVNRLFAPFLLLAFAPVVSSTLEGAAGARGARGASVTPGVPGPAAAPAPPAWTAAAPQRSLPASPSGYQTNHNDFLWTDQNGYPSATRSGCLCQFGEQFYRYGGGAPGCDQTCYESTDLVHWT